MQTRIIYTEIWQDDFFSNLIPDEKLLFLYFLTNDSVNIIHLYRCNLARVKADTGIDTHIILKATAHFEKAKKMFFKDGYIFLKNAHKFERYVGEKNEIAKAKLFSRLSKSIIDWYNNLSDTPIDTPTMIGTINHKSEIINPKEETINQKSSTLVKTLAEQIADEVGEGLKK